MAIAPIAAPRLHERIAAEIERRIAAGEFARGTRLPGERELARQFDVSRSSLREALGALELAGRVEIRVGSGVYVRAQPRRRAAGAGAGGPSPFEVLRARRVIEAETAALAAKHATPARLRELERALTRLAVDMRANRIMSPADRDFHVGIARASGNAALAGVVERLWDEGAQPLGARLEALYVTRGRKRDNIGEHRAVLDAIRAGDMVAARRAMRRHLLNAERQRMTLPTAT
jgi:DNA-binding FadR family transcriptional regulator